MSPDQTALILHRLGEIHDDLGEVRELAKETNGRVRDLERFRAKLEGATWAVGWVPPLATSLITAAVAAGLTTLLT